MWFKQVQVFQLTDALKFSVEEYVAKLEPLAFTSCLPTMPLSVGWVSPIDEEGAPMVRIINGCIMLCMMVEEKILPATVVRQELIEKVKEIEAHEARKVYSKRKLALKDEITLTLLPRAFSKLTRVYAYIDTRNQWLVVGSTNEKKTEQLISLFKKSITEKINRFEVPKLSPLFTNWVRHQNYPDSFGVEKSCTLQDPAQQKRVVRCQEQDLFAANIQAFLKDGYEVKQLSLSWHDRINFVLTETFLLQSVKYHEEILASIKDAEAETKQQVFDADFLIMAETLAGFLRELLGLVMIEKVEVEKSVA